MAEEELLRGDGSRGVDVQRKSPVVPALQSRNRILVDVPLKGALRVALGPYEALEGF